jgi:hypothetical protein
MWTTGIYILPTLVVVVDLSNKMGASQVMLLLRPPKSKASFDSLSNFFSYVDRRTRT